MPKLSDVASAIRAGDVIACRGISGIDWLIDHVTGSDYSHVAVVLEAGADPTLIQALGIGANRGVHTAPLSSLLCADVCDWLATGVIWTDDLDRYARGFIGQPYCYFADIEVAADLDVLTHQEICSVLAAQIMTRAGLKIETRGQTPARIANDLLAQDAVLRRLHP